MCFLLYGHSFSYHRVQMIESQQFFKYLFSNKNQINFNYLKVTDFFEKVNETTETHICVYVCIYVQEIMTHHLNKRKQYTNC